MSFIVKGIDMPKEGELHLIITKNGIIYGAEYPNKIKHAYPLNLEAQAIQIPKGHGRVIDGGELNKSVHTWNPAYTYGRSAFTRAIDNAPTILAEE